MENDFHYSGMTISRVYPNVSMHSFQLYQYGDDPVGTFLITVRDDEASTTDARIALAHIKFADIMRKFAAGAEAMANTY